MPSQQPPWALLPPDVWRRIATAARGNLQPVTAQDWARREWARHLGSRWACWWLYIARLGSTCRVLREALFGPDAGESEPSLDTQAGWSHAAQTELHAGELHDWVFLQDPRGEEKHLGLRQPQRQGLHQMLLRQSPHARGAFLLGESCPSTGLAAAAAHLTGVQDLVMEGIWFDSSAAEVFAALQPRQLQTLALNCFRPFKRVESLLGLQELRLTMNEAHQAELRELASWLPRLQRLELVLDFFETSDSHCECSLQNLSLLPTDELRLQLTFPLDIDGRYSSNPPEIRSVEVALKRLAGVQLHSLEIICHRRLPCKLPQLEACQVSQRVLLSFASFGVYPWIERLASGAAVEYKNLGHKHEQEAAEICDYYSL